MLWLTAHETEVSAEVAQQWAEGTPEGVDIAGSIKPGEVQADAAPITTYQYETVGGQALRAFWTMHGQRFSAATSTEVGEQNQADMTTTLKLLLASVE